MEQRDTRGTSGDWHVEDECFELVINPKYVIGLRHLFRQGKGQWVDLVVLRPDTSVPPGRVHACWVDPLAAFAGSNTNYRTVIWVDAEDWGTYSASYNLDALPPPASSVE